MATMPGASVSPYNYRSQMRLYSAVEKVEAVVDGAPPGPEGRKFTVEPGKVATVPWEAGRFILEHLAYTGVVRVDEVETDNGVLFDVDKAKAESERLLRHFDEQRYQRYIDDMVTDYMNQKKPVPRPPEAIMKIMQRRGYDPKKQGILPMGWEEPQNERMLELQKKNAELEQKLNLLMALAEKETTKKEK